MIVGCGPYRLVRWEKDRRLLFERNPDYFGIAYGISPSLQYLVFEVFEDRVVFYIRNAGSYENYDKDDKLKEYTVYFRKNQN